jgi:hypothetical protein
MAAIDARAKTNRERSRYDRVRRSHSAPAVNAVNALTQVRIRRSDEGCQWSGNATHGV